MEQYVHIILLHVDTFNATYLQIHRTENSSESGDYLFFLCDITFVNVIIYLFLITHSKHDEISVKERYCQGFVENIKKSKMYVDFNLGLVKKIKNFFFQPLNPKQKAL